MPPHMKVSQETKASIDCSEMDAQLEALRRNFPPVRISTSDRTQARFISMILLEIVMKKDHKHSDCFLFQSGRTTLSWTRPVNSCLPT